MRDLLNSERFCDRSPYQVYATLLDEGSYYCSISMMYRLYVVLDVFSRYVVGWLIAGTEASEPRPVSPSRSETWLGRTPATASQGFWRAEY